MSHFLCEDPIADNREDLGSLLYSYPKPSFIACVKEVGLLSVESVMMNENNYNIGFLYKDPHDKIKVFFIILIKQHDRSGPVEVQNALKETVNWYANCLLKQNPGTIGKKGGYMLLKDYNKHTPGLQVLYLPKAQRYILSFEKGITNFGDNQSMIRFFHEVLGYKIEQMSRDGEMTVIEM